MAVNPARGGAVAAAATAAVAVAAPAAAAAAAAAAVVGVERGLAAAAAATAIYILVFSQILKFFYSTNTHQHAYLLKLKSCTQAPQPKVAAA